MPWPVWLSWSSSCEQKGHQFSSQWGHMPSVRVQSSVQGACERQPIHVSLSHWCFSPSLSPSLVLSLKINKILKNKIKYPACIHFNVLVSTNGSVFYSKCSKSYFHPSIEWDVSLIPFAIQCLWAGSFLHTYLINVSLITCSRLVWIASSSISTQALFSSFHESKTKRMNITVNIFSSTTLLPALEVCGWGRSCVYVQL